MKRQLMLLLVATQFLTRLPVPHTTELPANALSDSARFFPLVGALIGVGAVALDVVVSRRAGSSVSVVLILVYLFIITGGLHEDGLADAADGFGGGWTKERTLAIMRDSNIGSFGAAAIVLSILARFVFLTNVTSTRYYEVLIAGQVLGRWATIPLAYWLPAARDDGQGARVAKPTPAATLASGSAIAVVIVGGVCGWLSIPVLLVSIAVALASGAYYHRRIGGITGDCLGATCQLTECTVYLTGVLW
jgi:adenosylcobinamide-GDP ribazoletransferase